MSCPSGQAHKLGHDQGAIYPASSAPPGNPPPVKRYAHNGPTLFSFFFGKFAGWFCQSTFVFVLLLVACHGPLVLYTPRAGRTLPAGEGGCAAGSLPPSHYLKLGPAVRCRSSPEFPFRFIWVLGWSTWYLCANDPTPCTCNTYYLQAAELRERRSVLIQPQQRRSQLE
jgi:hypothetical protein